MSTGMMRGLFQPHRHRYADRTSSGSFAELRAGWGWSGLRGYAGTDLAPGGDGHDQDGRL